MSKEIARYCSLVVGLGGSQDCQFLREELRLIRLKSYNLARQNMDTLAPFLQQRKVPIDIEHTTKVDKLLRLFCSTVEIFLPHLIRTNYLMAEFSFCNSSQELSLINTGITEALMGLKSSQAPLTSSSVRQLNEAEEIKLVERHVSEMERIVGQINQRIDHRPWESLSWEDRENHVNNNNARTSRGNSTLSFSQEAFTCPILIRCCLQRRHRCFQIVILSGLAILIFTGFIVGIYCSTTVC